MPVFDFHCHPSLKPVMSPEGAEPTPWDYLKARLKLATPFGNSIGINKLFNSSLNSQSNLAQLFYGKVNLVGVILYGMESMIAQGILQKKITATGKINLLDPQKMKTFAKGNNYYEWMQMGLTSLLNNLEPPEEAGLPEGVNFKFIKSIDEYDEEDLNTIHGIAIVEGLHNFCNNPDSSTAETDFNDNLKDFIKRYKKNNVRLFACNVCHLQDVIFANHASGMQFINDTLFYPKRKSLTDVGKRAIQALYSNNILVDIKHMSLGARLGFYAERDNQGYTLPIICTHAGLTGRSIQERLSFLRSRPIDKGPVWMVEHMKPRGHVKKPNSDAKMSAFNFSSINLYDEDILKILLSDGLIGISLDQRILGYPTESIGNQYDIYPSEIEYISKAEASIFFGPGDPAQLPVHNIHNDDVLTGDEARDHDEFTFDSHARYFLSQLLHILLVAKNAGYDLQKAITQVCIGSDFDGLINPVDCCESSEEFGDFKKQLLDIMNERNFWADTGFGRNEIDGETLLDGLFFDNAFAFMKKNFK